MSEQTDKPSEEDKAFGFDLYPERRSDKKSYTLADSLFFNRHNETHDRVKCEKNVVRAIKKNPLIKVLIGALKKNGCPINLRRHIVCEECDTRVTGGYDTEFNQIVVCQNTFKVKKSPEPVIIHELIHMYDYCTGKVDFKNLEHLACTEIRAANIAHCSFISSFLLGQSSFINIKKTHQYCVKLKAAQAMMVARNIDFETAMDYILKVFDKCYNDLEPIGRRIRRKSMDGVLSLREAEHFDICDKMHE